MDYKDMADSLRQQQQLERSQPGYYDGCTKFDWELDKLCQQMEKNAVVVKGSTGTIPRIQEFVDIAKSMSQGSGGVVSLCQ